MTAIDVTSELIIGVDFVPEAEPSRTIGAHRKRRASRLAKLLSPAAKFLVQNQLNVVLTFRQQEKVAAHRKGSEFKLLQPLRGAAYAVLAIMAGATCIVLLALGAFAPDDEKAGVLAMGSMVAVSLASSVAVPRSHKDKQYAMSTVRLSAQGSWLATDTMSRLGIFLVGAVVAIALAVLTPVISTGTVAYAVKLWKDSEYMLLLACVITFVVGCIAAAVAVRKSSQRERRVRSNHDWVGLGVLEAEGRQRITLKAVCLWLRRANKKPARVARHRRSNQMSREE